MEKVSPTRMNLLNLKQRLVTTRKGLELLESKREALVKEFFKMIDSAVTARGDLRKGMQEAKNALTLSTAVEGRERLTSAAFAAGRNLAIELSEKNIWGVRFPELRFQSAVRSLDARGYSITGTSFGVDNAARCFEEVVDRVLQAVSVEMRLKRVGEEIKKMTRRINALKEVILPPLRSQIGGIKNHLEEREHEEIFRVKRFKERRKY